MGFLHAWRTPAPARRFPGIAALTVVVLVGLAMPLHAQTGSDAAAPPFTHEKHLIELEDGRIFAAVDVPLYLRASLDRTGDASLVLPSDEADDGIYLNEGENRIPFGRSTLVVYGDGTAPSVTPEFQGAQVVRDGSVPVYGQGLTVAFSAEDGGSGVLDIFLSINGAPFNPYQAPLSDFKWNRDITVRYYAVDRVGNASPVQATHFLVDVRPPTTTASVEGTRDLEVYSRDVEISLTSSDAPAGVAAIDYRFDDQPSTRYRGPISLENLSGGPHRLVYSSADRVGNREAEQSIEFFLDRSAPELSHAFSGVHHERDGVTYVPFDTRIQLIQTDNRAGTKRVEYSINGSEWMPYALPFSLPQNSGSYTVRYRGSDKVGNSTSVQTAKVYLDKTPPATDHVFTAATFSEGNRTILTSRTGIVLTALDLEAGVETIWVQRGSNDPVAYDDTLYFAEEGDLNLRYWSEDRLGNTEEASELMLRVDNSPRQATRQAEVATAQTRFVERENNRLAGATTHPFYLRISASPEDTAASFLLAFNTASGDTFPLTLPAEGAVPVTVRMPDSTTTYSIFADGTAPSTRASYQEAVAHESSGQRYFGSGLKVDLSAADGSGVGVEHIYYSVNGATYTTYEHPLELFFSERQYSLAFYASDVVGNAEAPETHEFIVDLTPPATRYTLGGTYYGNTLSPLTEIELLATDNLCGVARILYTIDDGDTVTYRRPLGRPEFGALKQGDHELSYWAVDHVGNVEQPRQFLFVYDPTPPRTDLAVTGDQADQAGTRYVSPRTRITLSADDDQLEIQSREIRVNDDAFTPYTGPLALPATSGRYTIVGRTRDIVGNVTTTPPLAVFLDADVPTTEVSLNGPTLQAASETFVSPETRIEFTVSDQHSGVKTVGGRVNGGSYRDFSNGLTLSSEGRTSVQYQAVDRVNNREALRTLDVIVDATPPSIQFSFSDPQLRTEGDLAVYPASVTLYVEANDRISEVERVMYRMNGEERLYRTPLTGFTAGDTVAIEVEAVDRLGNQATRAIRFLVE